MSDSDAAAGPLVVDWREGQREVRWRYRGGEVVKSFPEPPQTVLVAAEPLSVIVVEAFGDEPGERLDNAVVLEPSGEQRLRLVPPDLRGELHWMLGFHAVYAEPDGLVAVFATSVGDFWGRPDLTTGVLADVAQWR